MTLGVVYLGPVIIYGKTLVAAGVIELSLFCFKPPALRPQQHARFRRLFRRVLRSMSLNLLLGQQKSTGQMRKCCRVAAFRQAKCSLGKPGSGLTLRFRRLCSYFR